MEEEVRDLLIRKEKVNAIKLVREQTGVGLKEAKEYVEALEKGECPPTPQSPLPVQLSGDLAGEVRYLLAQDKKVNAIKLVRQITGIGLMEAKEAVEALGRGLHSPSPQSTSSQSISGDLALEAQYSDKERERMQPLSPCPQCAERDAESRVLESGFWNCLNCDARWEIEDEVVNEHVDDEDQSRDIDEDDVVRDLLKTCDHEPLEGLAWIDRLGEDLQSAPMTMFARFVALRKLVLQSFLVAGVRELSSASQATIERIMDMPSRAYAVAALEQAAAIEASHPGYIDSLGEASERFARNMVDDICIVNERLQPGAVQAALGWTKLHYFGDERIKKLPALHEGADDVAINAGILTMVRPPRIARSAVLFGTGTDARRRRFMDACLLERDLRTTPTVGDANMFCAMRVFEDGEVEFSVRESDAAPSASVDVSRGEALSAVGTIASTGPAGALPKRTAAGRWIGRVVIIGLVGVAALAWLFSGDSPEDSGSWPAVSPQPSKSDSAARVPSQRVLHQEPTYLTEFPRAFAGTWELPEGCSEEVGTDARVTLKGDSAQFWESRCNARDLRLDATTLHGIFECEGEGEKYVRPIEFQLIDGKLISSAPNGASITRVRCGPDTETSASHPGRGARPPQQQTQGVETVDGTQVSWMAPDDPISAIATFSFHDKGYENRYELDCRARRFRWISNYDLRAGRFTGNASGADWNQLSDGSKKANAAFRVACDDPGPTIVSPDGVAAVEAQGDRIKSS